MTGVQTCALPISEEVKKVPFERAANLRKVLERAKLEAKRPGSLKTYCSNPYGQWAVVREQDRDDLPMNAGAQILFVRETKDAERTLGRIGHHAGSLQAVALEAGTVRRKKITQRLSEMGVTRITRAGRLQFPPLCWHHDGTFNFSNWVRWTDLEN